MTSSAREGGRKKTRHRQAIDMLCEQRGLRDRGFAAAMLRCIPEDDRPEAKKILRGAVPDAWKINGLLVDLYEVTDTHHISEQKVLCYADWAEYLSDFGYELRVLECSVHYGVTRRRDVLLEWLGQLQKTRGHVSDPL